MKHSILFSVCVCLILTVYLIGRAQKLELVVQTGPGSVIRSITYSPDGETVASGSWHGPIKLWDVVDGQELRTLNGHAGDVWSVAFSPDGKTLASGGQDRTIKLWDVVTGQVSKTLTGHTSDVRSIAFSPDGKTLASGGAYNDRTIKLWDVAAGRELSILTGHANGEVLSVAFSPDGKTLVSAGGWDETIKLWDVQTGKELKTLNGHNGFVNTVAFSPDGKTVASGAGDETIKLWDVANGQELKALRGHTSSITSIAFSPDGKTLASASSGDKTVRLWDVASGRQLNNLTKHTQGVWAIAFSPDGEKLVSGGGDKTIKLWSVTSGQELKTLNSHTMGGVSVVFSPDSKTIASGSEDIKLWSVTSGQQLKTLEGHTDSVRLVVFSPDGKTLASELSDKRIRLWDVATDKELKTLTGHTNSVRSIAFSPDGKTLASVSWDKTIRLWDVQTGKELRILSGHGTWLGVASVTFSPDSKTLASIAMADRTIKLWDVSTGQELRTLEGHTWSVESVAFSPDGRTLASGSGDHSIKLWDVPTGRELKTLAGHKSIVNAVAFSPDGRVLASTAIVDNSTKLWDVVTGKELKSFQHDDPNTVREVYNVVPALYKNNGYEPPVSSDGRFQAKWDQFGGLGLFEVKTGKLLASLITFIGEDWMVVTPDGLFDGSPAAWSKIIWRFNNNTYNYASVEAFFNDFYYPGLLADIFAGKRPKALSDISRKDRRQPQIKLSLADAQPDATLRARNVTVKVDVSQALAGAQDVRLFRNGSLVKVWHGNVLKGRRSITLESTIPIVAGENRLTAYAFNRDNIKSSDATLVVNGAESLMRQGTAYILAVGVNSYSNSQYNLKYAVADAQAFSAEVKRQQEMLKNYGQVEVISLSDNDATKANIIHKLARLAGRVQPEDAVVVYFAGHGTAQRNRFYLIPHDLGYNGPRTKLDEAGLRAILAHSISDRELEAAFEKIDAGQILLVIDACNSGQALEAEEKRRGPMNSKGLAQLAYEKGMYILTAAQSYQAALEAARLGHGYLTYALVIEGLKGGAADDEPNDHAILAREWFNYATNRVPQMQLEKLKEARDLREDFSFVEGEARDVAVDKREVQRPRVFYRREMETNPLVVARPQ